MAKRRMMSDEVANIIAPWDADDELLSVEKVAFTQLTSTFSPATSLAFIATKSSDEN